MLTNLEFAMLNTVQDILYYDGPWLSLMRQGPTGPLFLQMRHDITNEEVDSYMLVAITDSNLAEFKARRITLLEVMRRSSELTVFRYAPEKRIEPQVVTFDSLVDGEKPSDQSFYPTIPHED